MATTVTLSDKLTARIEAIASRSTLTPAELVADALENGRSLSWYEHFLDDVDQGIAEAARGDFAGDDEIAALRSKHRAA